MGRKEWQYHTVRYFGEGSSGKVYATHADGGRIGGVTAAGVAYVELHAYLSQIGLEGWEVVGAAGTFAEGFVILKREVLYG